MIGLSTIYGLAGLLFLSVAIAIAFDGRERARLGSALFYGLIGASFLAGDHLGDLGNGCLALVVAGLASVGVLERPTGPAPPRARPDAPKAWRLLLPALAIPAIAFAGAALGPGLHIGASPLLQPGSKSLPALGGLAAGVLVASVLAFLLLRPRWSEPVAGARGIVQALGWMALLPQMLTALGVVFAFAGVGEAISRLAFLLLPEGDRVSAVLAYCLGMAVLTVVMGNAFAAFPVMTAGLGLPLLVARFHGDPAAVGAIGMLSGFCGTLVTPLAANFNLAPVALLDLKDQHAVIRVQWPTAVMVLAGNVVLMLLLAFPR